MADRHLPTGRQKLARVLQQANDLVQIDHVVAVLGLPRNQAAKLLARWAEQGWLRRVGKGTYVPVPLDRLESPYVLEDPWVLVPAFFQPGYVGGRTAAEHWDLTEQIFRDIVVFTNVPIRSKQQVKHGITFTLKHIGQELIFGTRGVWRGKTKVMISDVHKTIIDILNFPDMGGGIQHVTDCLKAYLEQSDRDDNKLIEYVERVSNGAIFKRLGFLLEHLDDQSSLAFECKKRLTTGNAKLDPLLDCPRMVTRWRLRIPESWRM